MKGQEFNKDNQWQAFLETGKQVPLAIKPKETVDIQAQLRTKYPSKPIPTHRALRTVSEKQRRAVSRQEGKK